MPAPSGPAPLRASDADRDRVADRLREALAEGRITPEEHAERIDAVYRARTYADLEPVLHDLPGGPELDPRVSLRKDPAPAAAPPAAPDPAEPPPVAQSPTMVAIFGGTERKGRWLVGTHTSVTCVFGGAELDFRRAVLTAHEVTVQVVAVFGGVELTVPPGVRVVSSVAAVFGGVDSVDDEGCAPDAPVIRLTGMALFGGVSVKRRELGASRAERRRERREEHRRRAEERAERHRERIDDRRARHLEERSERRAERTTRRDHHRRDHGTP